MMNDRFRFRFYSEAKKQMVYDVNNHAPQELMQCTGLKDKNGKLIYEGDIVTGKDHFNRDRKCIVRYSETYCCYFIVGDGWSDEYMFNLNDKEVIGNIYENKELLNE